MPNTAIDALHQTHTATNDVLTGYETMLQRAEPQIVPIISDLVAVHRQHASALQLRLHALGQSGADDTSFRGTVNSVAVTVRDWLAGIDEGSLDAVAQGESALQDIYGDVLDGLSAGDDPQTAALLEQQRRDIGKGIDRLARRTPR